METIYRYCEGSWDKLFIEPDDMESHNQSWTERLADLLQFDGNIVRIEAKEDYNEVWGSYIYYQNLEEKDDNKAFKFYLSKDELVLIHLNIAEHLDTDDTALLRDTSRRTPIENFLVILKNTTDTYMKQIDHFERVLHSILWQVKERNNTDILDAVAKADHQLLICKTQVVTVTEVQMVIQEAFDAELDHNKYFKQLDHRLKRARFLIDAYEQEIDALLDFESVVSSHRGNEITKTLTLFTALFTPGTLLGAIWGMNFKYMPELDWKIGYLLALLLIIGATFGVYFYLKGKGWMGDLLDTHNKKKFF